MSTLETNSIGKYSGNNVAVDDSLNLKSYTTTQRDALTSATGDMIYNSTLGKVQIYGGSSWSNLGDPNVDITFVIVAGGGGGNTNDDTAHGAGGGGGYLSNVNSENSGGGESALPSMKVPQSTNFTVTIGAGGSSNSIGSESRFGGLIAVGGGQGGRSFNKCGSSGSPNGRTSGGPTSGFTNNITGQGFGSGDGVATQGSGGAGGAGGAGANGTSGQGGAGGAGVASSITGSSVTRAGGGGGGGTTGGAGGSGGGGAGGSGNNASGTSGTVNTGGGGGGSGILTGGTPGSGGSGIVILKYPDSFTATIGSGLTSTTATSSGFKITSFTAGTDTVSFA
tara:strand:+ start:529 stop:1539 length:1011 start_codon:yes stop_codon:yes gene_type:complete